MLVVIFHSLCRFSDAMTTRLSTNLRHLSGQIKFLFNYKQRLLENNSKMCAVKMHLMRHSHDWVKLFGSLLLLDSERWETFHKSVAKNVYRQSQKRRVGTLDIMTDKVCNGLYRFLTHFLICF